MEWTSDQAFTLDGVAYSSMVKGVGMMVFKPRHAIEQYQAMIEQAQPRRIVELGIYNGGSAALLAQIARPERLVAIDNKEDCPALSAFLAAHPDLPVSAYYGVDQADTHALDRIMAAEFDGPVDLVIDDASHLEPQSRASFNRLFPHLRPSGLYVIE
ncbi:MAG: class I SAM-dependent methyltransferase, partial [Acidimicrobiales bacterium]